MSVSCLHGLSRPFSLAKKIVCHRRNALTNLPKRSQFVMWSTPGNARASRVDAAACDSLQNLRFIQLI